MSTTPFLPLEVVFNILLCLPADFLYNCGRNVCRSWRSIIDSLSFIEEHILRSKGGLFFQEASSPYCGRSLRIKDGEFSTTYLRYCFPCRPMDSCRGLCLFVSPQARHSAFRIKLNFQYDSRPLYVVNPVTLQTQQLPSLGFGGYNNCCHLAYIPQSKEYKVVCLYSEFQESNWFLFTLGTNESWKKITSVPTDTRGAHYSPFSVTVGHFLYFCQNRRTIVAVNLYDETTFSIQLPDAVVSGLFRLRRMGDTLSCVANEGLLINVWMLRDLESSVWVKYCVNNVAISVQKENVANRRNTIYPSSYLGCLDNRKIFIHQYWEGLLLIHNVETCSGGVFRITNSVPLYPAIIHTDSLIKW